jgi:asparagine synthetase B (glutamine-hydrolysing)
MTEAEDGGGFHHVTPLEMAAGWVPGRLAREGWPHRSGRGPGPTQPDPRRAMERLLLPALQRTPCVVGFSGGRDSSAVLAVAVDVARREGLEPPVAVTNVYPGLPETEEREWQELVLRHLGVVEWVRQEFDAELDLMAPSALASVRRHGVLWPATLHNRAPAIAVARGGAYVDGEGGDEMLGDGRVTPWTRLVRGAQPVNRRSLRRLARVVGPRPLRAHLERRSGRRAAARSWLRPAARAWFEDTAAEDEARRPLSYHQGPLDFLRRRAVQVSFHNLDRMGHHLGVTYVHPLLDPQFARALGALGGRLGFVDRTDAMRAVFGDLLPEAVLDRRTKVFFNNAYAHRHTRAFVESWDGSGLDDELIDVEALRDVWAQPGLHGGTFQLLHAAWHATQQADASVAT